MSSPPPKRKDGRSEKWARAGVTTAETQSRFWKTVYNAQLAGQRATQKTLIQGRYRPFSCSRYHIIVAMREKPMAVSIREL